MVRMRFRFALLACLLPAVSCALTKIGQNSESGSESTARSGLSDAQHQTHYSAVIDAGSSGSRIYLYAWTPPSGAYFPESIKQIAWSKKQGPGIASIEDPKAAAESLRPLLQYAAEKISDHAGEAYSKLVGNIAIYLKGTAGFRIAPQGRVEKILAEVRALLKAEGYRLAPRPDEGVSVISGEEEGFYGWLSLNYLLGTLPLQAHHKSGVEFTIGALDMGGASTQITFATADLPATDGFHVDLMGTRYNIYSRSFLGYGLDQARKKLATRNCFPVGLQVADADGAGDFDACIKDVLPGLMSGQDIPAIDPGMVFYAFSGYSYTSAAIGLHAHERLGEFGDRGREYCRLSMDDLVKKYPKTSRTYLERYCFQSAYIYALLLGQKLDPRAARGYAFPAERRDEVIFADKVETDHAGPHEVGWALGAMIAETLSLKLEH